MIRGNLGPGCLSLPHAFAATGIILSGAISVPIIVLCLFSFNVLLWAKKKVVSEGLAPGGVRLSYSDIAVASLGPAGRVLVEIAVCTTQLGVCTVYYSFVATNTVAIFDQVDKKVVILCMMPVASAMTLIKSPGQLTILSTVGNLCMFTGLFLVFVALAPNLSTGFEDVKQKTVSVSVVSVAAFASNMIFSFEGIALMIPMEFAMIRPTKFPGIMTFAMCVVATIFLIFATYCVIGLGGVVNDGSISAAMAAAQGPLKVPNGFIVATNAILGVAVLATFPLQCYPALEIFDVHLEQRGVNRNGWGPSIMRLIVSVLCGCVALAVPNVSALVGLVGSLGSPMLGLLLPPAIHIMAKRPPLGLLIMDCLVLALGLFALIFGTYSSVKDIIEQGLG